MAIFNWKRKTSEINGHHRSIDWFVAVVLALLGSFTAGSGKNFDVPPSSLHPRFTPYALELLAVAKQEHEANPGDVEAAWKLGKAYFFLGEFATNKTSKSEIATKGIAACEIAHAAAPKSAEVNYYYALNQGQLARTKLFAALGLVRQMEAKLMLAAAAKPELDHAGPNRCLALLYRDAPGWPISIGDKKKAHAQITKLKQLAPDFPENVVVWLETWIKWKDHEALVRDLPPAEATLKAAKKKFTGRAWEPYWDDWDRRWLIIQHKAKELLPPTEK